MADTVNRKAQAQVLYLYGISAHAAQPIKISGAGIDGSSAVEGMECSGFDCWISRVDKREYGDQLAANMEDLDWLAATSVRHQRVVGQIATRTTILPTRFGTVFLSEESLQRHASERKQQLLQSLQKIEGTEEWGVKLFAAPPPAQAPVRAASGKDYLKAKSARLQPSQRKELDPEVKDFIQELQTIAADSAVSGKVSSGQRNLEWQASFLLHKSKRKEWDAVLRKYATAWQERRQIECTGPWPPYSFV